MAGCEGLKEVLEINGELKTKKEMKYNFLKEKIFNAKKEGAKVRRERRKKAIERQIKNGLREKKAKREFKAKMLQFIKDIPVEFIHQNAAPANPEKRNNNKQKGQNVAQKIEDEERRKEIEELKRLKEDYKNQQLEEKAKGEQEKKEREMSKMAKVAAKASNENLEEATAATSKPKRATGARTSQQEEKNADAEARAAMPNHRKLQYKNLFGSETESDEEEEENEKEKEEAKQAKILEMAVQSILEPNEEIQIQEIQPSITLKQTALRKPPIAKKCPKKQYSWDPIKPKDVKHIKQFKKTEDNKVVAVVINKEQQLTYQLKSYMKSIYEELTPGQKRSLNRRIKNFEEEERKNKKAKTFH